MSVQAFSRFLKNTSGATAMMFALTATPGIMAVGAAIDLGRAQVAKGRLQSTLDSAALAIAGTVGLDEEGKTALAQAYIDANYPDELGEVLSFEIIENDVAGTVELTAVARVSATFLNLFGVQHLDVAESTEVKAAENALLVSMVLDVTGSMWSGNNISALRDSARELVKIIYGDLQESPNLRVALVPYAAAVNLGAEAENVVAAGHGLGAAGSSDLLGWKGCVVERAPPHTLADTPAGPGQYWTPFRAPVDLDNRWVEGDARSVEPGGTSNSNGFRGPNLGCPNPIVPLTKSRTTIDTAINNLTAWNRGGTLTDIGMAWGIRTLSPGAPFTESAETDPKENKSLWEAKRWQKAIILMTDGESQFHKLNGTANATNQPAAPKGYTRAANTSLAGIFTDYTGYGRFGTSLATSIFGSVTASAANGQLTSRIESLCTEAKRQKITVYTVVFTSGVGSTVRDMYRRCASDPGKYWYAPSQGALKQAFKQIGQDLIRLHVSQ